MSAGRRRVPAWLIALGAIVRRDLTGGRRQPIAFWARAVVIVSTSGFALLSWGTFQHSGPNGDMFLSIVATLAGCAFLLAPVLGIFALRRERASGMLDLLALAGVTPRVLVAGRIISSFLVLESLLVAALPAASLFWLFRSPTPASLLRVVLVLSVFHLLLASLAVAVSAWSRSTGMALALAGLVLGSWLGFTLIGSAQDWDGLLPAALLSASGTELARLVGLHDAEWPFIASHGALAAFAAIVAVAGVDRRAAASRPDVLMRRIERTPPRLGTRPPLTWLVQRLSAPARPGVQAPLVLIVVAIALASWRHDTEVTAIWGSLLVLCGLVAGAALAATTIAPARDQRQWTSLASTAMSGRNVLLGYARAAVAGSAVPILSGLGLLALALSRLDNVRCPPVPVLVVSVLAAWAFLVAAGLAASLAAPSTGGALALAAGLLVLEPALAVPTWLSWSQVARAPFADAAGAAAWTMLVLDGLLFSGWLFVRAGFGRSRLLTAAGVLPAILTLSLPLAVGDREEGVALAAIFGAIGIAGLVLFAWAGRTTSPVARFAGAGLACACLLTPLFLLAATVDDKGAAVTVGGGLTLACGMLVLSLPTAADATPQVALVGAAHHLTLVLVLGLAFLPRLERWLGRAG